MTSERESFDQWATANHLDTHLATDGDYFDAQTAAAWFTWQGRAQLASERQLNERRLRMWLAALERAYGHCDLADYSIELALGDLNAALAVAALTSRSEGRCVRVGLPCECAPEARTGCVSWADSATTVNAVGTSASSEPDEQRGAA